LSLAEHQNPSTIESNRRESRLKPIGLSDLDHDACISALAGLRERLDVIEAARLASAGNAAAMAALKAQENTAVGIAYLLDPVARAAYMILPEAKVAARTRGPEAGEFQVALPAVGRPLPAGKWRTITERLGARVLHGLEVEGSRTIQNSEDGLPPGAASEEWVSRSLHLTVSVRASGPGWMHTAGLVEIDFHEPDPKLFVIPPDCRIQD